MADNYNPFLDDIDSDTVGVSIADCIEVDVNSSQEELSTRKETLTPQPNELNWDIIAAKLIKDNLVLTALELHTELVESGRELPRLRDYFSNPGNFERQDNTFKDAGTLPLQRTSSVATFDSLDFARYSDDGVNQADERCAVLEFELRKAKETIKSLRVNLTEAAECELSSPTHSKNDNVSSSSEVPQDLLKPHEKRALNFLINEYLLKNEYKLTSITFSDENEDQDFDDWDDVGLNISRPPDVLHLYRDYGNHVIPAKETRDIGCGEDVVMEEQAEEVEADQVQVAEEERKQFDEQLVKLTEQVITLNEEKETLKKQIEILERDIQELNAPKMSTPMISPIVSPKKNESTSADMRGQDTDTSPEADSVVVQVGSPQPSQNVANTSANLSSSDKPLERRDISERNVTGGADLEGSLVREEPEGRAEEKLNRNISDAFREAMTNLTYADSILEGRLAEEVSKIARNDEGVVLMLARCLPHIVPNVLLAKREELIPVILYTVSLHPDTRERDKLLNILFNLIKKPDEEQRQMILRGCVAFAQHVGPARLEEELLPQCWEEISHKYQERRLLVAESCGVLTPHLTKEIRSSLLLSMLQMMLDDKANEVRQAVIKSLGVVLTWVDDQDKYNLGWELLCRGLHDSSEAVVATTLKVLLPSFSSWALELGRLEKQIIGQLLKKLEDSVKNVKSNPSSDNAADVHSIQVYCQTLQTLTPVLFAAVLLSAPFTQGLDIEGAQPLEVTRFPKPYSGLLDLSVLVGSRELLAAHVGAFESHIGQSNHQEWDTYSWVLKEYLPRLLEVSCNLDMLYVDSIKALSKVLNSLSKTFGKSFTETRLKPKFQAMLNVPDEQYDTLIQSGQSALTKAIVPVFVSGVLSCYNTEDDRKQLATFLQDTIATLAVNHASMDSIQLAFAELHHNPTYHELLLTVLWNGVVDTSARVRIVTANMFTLLSKNIHEGLVSSRIVPALITLAGDEEIMVRIATVPAFGAIIESTTQKETLDRVYLQLQHFLDDPQYKGELSMLVEIIRIFGVVGPNTEPKFRDEFILPRLAAIAHTNNNTSSRNRQSEVAMGLFEAYSALSCCFISEVQIRDAMLPGLRCLRQDLETLSPEHEVVVSSMIKDLESKISGRERRSWIYS
ncbi:RAB11-binding protein RELCH homolog isoform X2 [Antedon mediterranea]|uniref:RAB11-binding protein RELCH homolog isoform X2 n=1 Tax=Antedon mediterranea TaxID=105859 RepID=UPI003AF70566